MAQTVQDQSQRQTAEIPLGYDLQTALTELAKIRDYYSQFPFVRRAALEFGAPSENDDVEGMVRNLVQFVKDKMVYVADPLGFEYVTAPDILLAEIVQKGRSYGDCDDHTLLLNTLLATLGIPTAFQAVKLDPSDPLFNHVISGVLIRDRWEDIDTCAKQVEQPDYAEKFIVR